ncbi:hypothetical protein [Mycoplasma parvum]|uniref:Aspartyl/glutamyl-tRNA(Asn/Gln) amidotransferase subunit B n=1 Tax=Mycoplasma parvum str. Indiana TaxID=1403316 RepID=U5NC89_9MOLU|nr:hypothetical protein [Mycoplasma parvum]AGX89037.1 hypothetical protein PRV_01385 [Mycoplasma parvum str. Indiana]
MTSFSEFSEKKDVPQTQPFYKLKMGLEVHATLMSEKKAFVNIPIESSSYTSLGLLGTLPQINTEAIRLVLKLFKALNSEVPSEVNFVRKSYFYFDLPKGYQITQYQERNRKKGYIFLPKTNKKINISAISLEEDTAAHQKQGEKYLLLVERLGNPLVEISTEPELRSIEEVIECVKWIRFLLFFLHISKGELEKGNFRVDLNISLENEINEPISGRAEVKNLASFKAIEGAIPAVQTYFLQKIAENSDSVFNNETLRWDEKKEELIVMRDKVEAQDYLLVPESCIPTIKLSEREIEEITKNCEASHLFSLFISIMKSKLASREQEELIENYEFFWDCYKVKEVLGDWANSFFVLKIFNSINGGGDKVNNLISFLKELLKKLKLNAYSEDFKFNNLKIRESCKKLMSNTANIKEIVTFYLDSVTIKEEEIISFCETLLQEKNKKLIKLIGKPDKVTSFLLGEIRKKYGGQIDIKGIKEIVDDNLTLWMGKYFSNLSSSDEKGKS